MQAAKETAANIGASAKSGMEKTKATVQEKVFPLFSQLSFSLFLFSSQFFFPFLYVCLFII